MKLILLDQKKATELGKTLLDNLTVMEAPLEGSVHEVAKSFHITETQARQVASWAQTFSRRLGADPVFIRTPKPGAIKSKTLSQAEKLLETKGLSPRLDFFVFGPMKRLRVVAKAQEHMRRKKAMRFAA